MEWARIEPVEGEFSEEALAHYAAVIDRCLELGIAPVVTFNHFTCPHWFAMRGGWLDPGAAERFARYCGTVMDRLGGGIAVAITLNEPNLPRLLSWLNFPEAVARAWSARPWKPRAEAAGVDRYRLANVVLPEEFDAMEDGLAAGHLAAKAAIKSRRPDLPLGLSLAVVDDQAMGDATVRDRKRAEVYARWLRLARDDDFIGVQNYERARYDADGPVPPPEDAPRNAMGSDIYPPSLAGAVRYVHAETGRPGPGHRARPGARRRHLPRPVHRGRPARPARRDRRRRAGPRLPALDAAGQLRVDLRLPQPARPARGRPQHVRAHREAQRRRAGPASPGNTPSEPCSSAVQPVVTSWFINSFEFALSRGRLAESSNGAESSKRGAKSPNRAGSSNGAGRRCVRAAAAHDAGRHPVRRPRPSRLPEAGHALRAPSRLHAFNRYEIKYLVPSGR